MTQVGQAADVPHAVVLHLAQTSRREGQVLKSGRHANNSISLSPLLEQHSHGYATHAQRQCPRA